MQGDEPLVHRGHPRRVRHRSADRHRGQDLGEYHETTAGALAELLEESQTVVIAPGYGMAVAKAQNQVAELTEKLRAHGKQVRFAVHPVAGRLPGT